MQLYDHSIEVRLWRGGSATKQSSWFSSQSWLQLSPLWTWPLVRYQRNERKSYMSSGDEVIRGRQSSSGWLGGKNQSGKTSVLSWGFFPLTVWVQFHWCCREINQSEASPPLWSRLEYPNNHWNGIKFITYIHVLQRINSNDFGDPLIFHLASTVGRNFYLTNVNVICWHPFDWSLDWFTHNLVQTFTVSLGWIVITCDCQIFPLEPSLGESFNLYFALTKNQQN